MSTKAKHWLQEVMAIRVVREHGPAELTDYTACERARVCRSPEDALNIFDRLACNPAYDVDRESFWAVMLNAKNGVIAATLVTSGLLDASLVHPREVFRCAVALACASIVLLHNHPSGDTTPSAEDIRITRQLQEAGRILDIKVLDHVICADRARAGDRLRFCSMRENGVVTFN